MREGVQYPITGTPCDQYNCSLYPIDATFTSNTITADLALGGIVNFENNFSDTTSRVWNFGDGETDYTDSLIPHTFTQVGTYVVELIVFHGMCSDTMTQIIEVINTSGVDDLLLETGMSMFPNPSKGDFTVKFKNPFKGKMNISDLMGRNYYTTDFTKETQLYAILNIPKGVYLVEVVMKNGRKEVKRVVVE